MKLTTSLLVVVPENTKENPGRKRRPRYYPVPPMTSYDIYFFIFFTASIYAAVNTAMKRFKMIKGSGLLRLSVTDFIFNQTKKYSIMIHDDLPDSLIPGRLDIYLLQVDEENLLEMNDKELNDHMKDLVRLNYKSVDFSHLTDFYYKNMIFIMN